MAVQGTFYRTETQRLGVTPVSPPQAVDDPVTPLNPPGSTLSHDPVTLGSPANGLSLVGQQLSIGLASSGVTGVLSGTDWNTFNGKLNLTSLITGYTVGSNTELAATDNILQAFGKVQGQINARLSGTIASGQVAFGTAANTIGGDSGLVWNNVTKQLFIVGNVFPSFSITRTSDSFSGIEFKSGTISSQMYFGYRKTENALLSLNNLNTFSGIAILNSGSVGVQTTSPTDTVDINGTTRIRTINNLGTAATVLLTKSATGVISERTVAEVVTDGGLVTLAGTQTITGAKTFSNVLLIQEESAPVFRLKTTANTQSTINFRNSANEDRAGVQFDGGLNKFSILTRTGNCDIEINPHGTGKIKLPNIPTGTGDILARDSSNNLVRVTGLSPYKLLDEDITPTAFTSTTFSTILTGSIIGTNSFDGSTDASYEGELWIRSIDDASSTFDLRFSIWGQNIDVNISLGSGSQTWNTFVRFRLIVQGGNFLLTGQTVTMLESSNFENVKNINHSMTTYSATSTSSLDIQARCLGIGTPTLYPTSFVFKQIA